LHSVAAGINNNGYSGQGSKVKGQSQLTFGP